VNPGVALTTSTFDGRDPVQALDRLAQGLEGGVDPGIDQPRFLGELDRAGVAVEQGEPQALLQSADLVAERGRRHVQLPRGLREAQMTGRRLEGAQGIEGRQRPGHRALGFLMRQAR
jgi:hypothetical protein